MKKKYTKKELDKDPLLKIYKNKKVLLRLVKPKARTVYEFVVAEDMGADNDWFIDMNKLDKKSGKIKDTSLIIRKDIDGWIEYMHNMLGWLVEDDDKRNEKMRKHLEKRKKAIEKEKKLTMEEFRAKYHFPAKK